ncbi:MAG: YbaY family lipoprotein [Ilumatobacter sp.]|uniref:YbaY family lipoprotein n=2 Tax=Ilumatobacter sp. TaxID=1967498 RepID=UPI00329A6AA9
MGMKRKKTSLAVMTVVAMLGVGCGASDDSSSAAPSSPAPSSPGEPDSTTGDSTPTTPAEDQTMTTISGELTYRQRIALIPGGTATVTVSDVSLQDVAAPVIAEVEIELEDRQVPIPFDLEFDATGLDPRGVYSVRATITGPEGDLQWTTDTVNPIDPTRTEIDLGAIVLVQVTGSQDTPPGTDDTAPDPSSFVGEWNVVDIGGTPVLDDAPATMVFDTEGNLGGTTGCNSWGTTYSSEDGTASIDSEIVMTLIACSGDVGAQETAFLDIVNNVKNIEIVGDGTTLVVTSTDGAVLTARR